MNILKVSTGVIVADGNNGDPADSGYDHTGGAGGGGSGGSIYIEVLNNSPIGNNNIQAMGGNGGLRAGFANGGPGGSGSNGRIHIVGPYTGSTSSPPVE